MTTTARTKRKSPAKATPVPPLPTLPSVVIGRLVGSNAQGEPLVDFAGNPTEAPVPARATSPWTPNDIGTQVALVFESGSATHPIILGVMRNTLAPSLPVQLSADGQKLLLTAEREIEMRCGKASIVLTSAGKVLIRGEYVLSRSSGVNRIKGAAVEIN